MGVKACTQIRDGQDSKFQEMEVLNSCIQMSTCKISWFPLSVNKYQLFLVDKYVYICVCVHMHACVYVYLCMYVCVSVYTQIYVWLTTDIKAFPLHLFWLRSRSLKSGDCRSMVYR